MLGWSHLEFFRGIPEYFNILVHSITQDTYFTNKTLQLNQQKNKALRTRTAIPASRKDGVSIRHSGPKVKSLFP